MMKQVPYDFSTLFRQLTTFERLTAFRHDNLFSPFFPHDGTGRPDQLAVLQLFKTWAPDPAQGIVRQEYAPVDSAAHQYELRPAKSTSVVPYVKPLFRRQKNPDCHLLEPVIDPSMMTADEIRTFLYERMQPCRHFEVRSGAEQWAPDTYLSFGGSIYGGEDRDFARAITMTDPLYFGLGVRIHGGARVIGPSMIGDDVEIYGAGIVKRSAIRSCAIVRDGAHVSYSYIGSRVYIGANVTIADEAAEGVVCIPDYVAAYQAIKNGTKRDGYKPVIYETGLKRFGSVIGDRCHIGDGSTLTNVVLMPGTKIPNGVRLDPGVYDQTIINKLFPKPNILDLIEEVVFAERCPR